METIRISNIIFTISDEEILDGDFFVDLSNIDGKYIHVLSEYGTDHLWNGIDIVVLNKREFDWNKKMYNYKKIVKYEITKNI